MRNFLLITFLSFSLSTFANVENKYTLKISDILNKKIFNGSWTDTWGRKVSVVNIVSFPDNCLVSFEYSKISSDFIYVSKVEVDLSNSPPQEIKKSSLSAGVKLIFNDDIVATSFRNIRTQQVKNINENISVLSHHPRAHPGFSRSLIQVLKDYQSHCQL
ncbi:MAG: hypothetical protein HON90_08220 [Halobacteriovoraceae bacterium]|jgi:hypothetical protein|nr:hypothetical protein [Halobacteriovoraceae bacterium]